MSTVWEQESFESQHKAEIDRALRFVWVLWAGCLGEPIVLIVLVHALGGVIRENIRPSGDAPIGLIRAAFLGLGVVVLALSFVFRRYLLSSGYKGSASGAGRPAIVSVPLLSAEYIRRACPSMVLAAAPAILGFFLFVLGDSLGVFYLFAAPAILATLWHHPSRDEIIALAGRLERADQDQAGRGGI